MTRRTADLTHTFRIPLQQVCILEVIMCQLVAITPQTLQTFALTQARAYGHAHEQGRV